MALKKKTVMVDEEDLALIKQAAAREGRPASEYFREALHLVALRTRRRYEDWDIPSLDFGGGSDRLRA
ncbi:ribbon-helix-helix protein, CopG family [Streptomyces albus]|uniref:ribbon-helix-helix protein, CopG family n=1 Tax=Streptomyces albus TaxID=1888 RepID=UPI00068B8A9F|nr:ribbon-helix-helix protein, CopG family [Streptomyces albus]